MLLDTDPILRDAYGGARLAGAGCGLQIHYGAVTPSWAGSIPVRLRSFMPRSEQAL